MKPAVRSDPSLTSTAQPGPVAAPTAQAQSRPAPLTLVLPLAPSANNIFANKKNGKGRFKSKGYQTWILNASLAAAQQGLYAQRFLGSVKVAIGLPQTMRGDLDNRAKPTLDWLVWKQIISDDRDVVELRMTKTYLGKSEMIVTVEAA